MTFFPTKVLLIKGKNVSLVEWARKQLLGNVTKIKIMNYECKGKREMFY